MPAETSTEGLEHGADEFLDVDDDIMSGAFLIGLEAAFAGKGNEGSLGGFGGDGAEQIERIRAGRSQAEQNEIPAMLFERAQGLVGVIDGQDSKAYLFEVGLFF